MVFKTPIVLYFFILNSVSKLEELTKDCYIILNQNSYYVTALILEFYKKIILKTVHIKTILNKIEKK